MTNSPTEAELDDAAKAIRRGELVAFPTETVYGLGANALDETAVRRIYEAKQRPYASPLIVHVASPEQARSLVLDWPDVARRLTDRFWPGPLTIVLPKVSAIPDIVTAGLPTVGLRLPRHPVAVELIRRAAVPIAAPSANLFSEVSPTTAQHVRDSLGAGVRMVLDGGASQVGIESTVVALHRSPPTVLRPGMITSAELQQVAGDLFETEQQGPELVERIGQESPGQHPKHYAPRTAFYVLPPDATLPAGQGRIIKLPPNPGDYASELYFRLREADAERLDWIAVEDPPSGPEWDGIRDRLRRASHR